MKKVSTASFIVGVVLIVASIALFIFGTTSVNTPYSYSRAINGYTYTKVSYSISITGIINGFMMIIYGGIAFLGGLLAFILAAVTRGPKFPPKPGCGRGPKQETKFSSNYAGGACDHWGAGANGPSCDASVNVGNDVAGSSGASDANSANGADCGAAQGQNPNY
jgi:hypothetical protein